jgi:hypothetical protein
MAQQKFESLLRPLYEAHAVGAWLFAALWCLVWGIVVDFGRSTIFLLVVMCLAIAAWRSIGAYRLSKLKLGLIGKPIAFIDTKQLANAMSKMGNNLWLGWGYRWEPRHTRRAYEVMKHDMAEIYPKPWVLRLLGESRNPKDERGMQWIHGLEPQEKDILVPFDALKGHCAVIATTGSIKTRLVSLIAYPNKAEAFFEEVKTEMEVSSNGFQALFHVLKKRLTEKTAVGAVCGRLAEMADEFEQIILNFGEIVISSLGFRRLFGEELIGDLYSRANIASPRGPIHLPERLAYLNTVLASDDVFRQGDVLEFKGPARSVNCAVLSITTLPSAANSVHMDQLMSSPCEYIMVQTFKFMDRTIAEKTIQKAEEFYQNEVKSVMVRLFEQITKIESNKVNTGNLVLAQDAQEALVDLTAHEVMYGYYNMTLLALGDTPREAARSADILSTRMRSSGYSVTRERQGIFGAFLGSMPGNSKVQLRKYMVSVSNVADLAPIRTISQGEPTHPLFSKALGRTVPAHVRFMTPYGVPYDFNLHAEDLGHTVVIGGSGSGKTSLMQLLVAQFQKYYPSNTYIFDKDRSMALLTVLMGGAHVDMANPKGGGVMINPVKRMLKDGDLFALSRWVAILLTAQGESLSTEAMEKVSVAIQKMAALNEIQWRLGTLYNMLNGADTCSSNLASRAW